MKIKHIAVQTKVARSGMSIGEALKECIGKQVPGIPFVDKDGSMAGRFSVRHTFLLCCLPADVIHGAHLLGDDLEELNIPQIDTRELLRRTVDKYIYPDAIQLSPSFQAVKALAIMEQYDTSYLFVAKGGKYRGVVSRMSVAKAVLNHQCKTKYGDGA